MHEVESPWFDIFEDTGSNCERVLHCVVPQQQQKASSRNEEVAALAFVAVPRGRGMTIERVQRKDKPAKTLA